MNQKNEYELKEVCTFQEVFEKVGKTEDSLNTREEPISKIGHVRAYYDGYRWWGEYFSCRNSLKTDEFVKESQKIYKQLVVEFPNLEKLNHFCRKHPMAAISETEYNFYINGEAAFYWLRCILRKKDYNLYLNAYAKTER